jgi:hypothetical protein
MTIPASSAPTPPRPRMALGWAGCMGLLVASLAVAAIGLGRFVVLPMLVRAHALVDANLARTLAQPIHFRLAEITLAMTLVAFVLLPRWTRSRLASAIATVLVAGAAAWRAMLLPALYGAWSKVDLVAGRPVDRLQAATQLDGYEQAASLSIMFGLLAVSWIALRTGMSVAKSPAPAPAPNPSRMSAAGTIDVAPDPA